MGAMRFFSTQSGACLPPDQADHVLRQDWAAAAAQQLHEHRRLVNVTHTHSFSDVPAQALVKWRRIFVLSI